MKDPEKDRELVKAVIRISRYTIYITLIALTCIAILVVSLFNSGHTSSTAPRLAAETSTQVPVGEPSTGITSRLAPADAWRAPDESTIPAGKAGDMIRYGKELLVHTAQYFGPQGSVAHLTNGMNCQNCHLSGGTKLFGNDYAGFITSYPKLSGRSGEVESPSERIAECFDRSLAGKVPDTSKKEIQSILAYMKWVGKDVKKG